MAKMPDKKILRKKADDLWAAAVKEDWNHRCAICGKGGVLHAHHLIPRAHYAVRFDLRNGIALCSYCHIRCHNKSPHQTALAFDLWLESHHPERFAWGTETILSGAHEDFPASGKTAQYFCDRIRYLRQYVTDADYTRIVGKRFSQWLDEQGEQ